MEEHYLLAPPGLFSWVSYTSQSGHGATHSELDPHASVTNQENALQVCLWANLMEANCSLCQAEKNQTLTNTAPNPP